MIFAGGPGVGLGLRLAIEVDGTRVVGPDFIYLVHDVGPHDPEGRYARMDFDLTLPLGLGPDTPVVEKAGRDPSHVLEWGKTADGVVVRVRTGMACIVELEGYAPWDWESTWSTEDATLRGSATIEGTTAMDPGAPEGSFGISVSSDPTPDAVGAHGSSGNVRHVLTGPATVVYRVVLGPPHGSPAPRDFGALTDQLDRAAQSYEHDRVATDGIWAGAAESLTNNLHWMVCIQPETGRLYTPAGRRWIFPHFEGSSQQWTIFEWDSFFNALELAVESPGLARAALDAVLETQYPSGCIPNWRGRFFGTPGRSQPPIGAFCVLRLYLRTGDRSLVEHAFPYLQRWSEWWYAERNGSVRRDGNGNGLFEWGTDTDAAGRSPAPWENEADGRQLAAWESGQDDLPNWDASGWSEATCTATLDAVDLNCYLALDHECLATLADLLGFDELAAGHRDRQRALAERINDELWDDERGLYLDRHWDGHLSDRVASTNFLPLLAGVAPPERVVRMLDTLLDETRFWGDSIVPTISRDDPAFPDQQYWRGTIWPPTSYLLYHGLRRAGRDAEASHLAVRSVELFMASWRSHRLCCENYDARTGEWGGRRYQSWGPLLVLAGLEEYIDVTPWEGLRIGTLDPAGDTSLRHAKVRGSVWSVSLSPTGLTVERDGSVLVTSDRPVVLRHVVVEDGVLTATVTTRDACRLVTREEEAAVPAGRHAVRMAVGTGG